MTKLPAYEDWRRPWKDGELNEDVAAKLVYNLKLDVEKAKEKADAGTAAIAAVQGKLDEAVADLAAKGDKTDRSEAEKDLQRQVRELEQAAKVPDPKLQGENDRLRIAIKTGLSLADVDRLKGATLEELEADAVVFAKDHGIELAGEGNEGDDPPSRGVVRRTEFRTGNEGAGGRQGYETDPSKVVLPTSYR